MSIQFSLMTYNVHSGIGSDNKPSPERIAEVIAGFGPDIVALQELDIGLSRSGMVDQAKIIADLLNMHFHFHPSFHLEEGFFGNAVLSRYHMRLVKAGELPTFRHRRKLEQRGALWVECLVDGTPLNLINTHLGLNRRERLLQIDKLLGPEWGGGPSCTSPVIICGDLNASPVSRVYTKLKMKFDDAQKRIRGYRPRSTWPGICPFMRIDHVFVSPDISVTGVSVPRTKNIRSASDHLPLLVNMKIP